MSALASQLQAAGMETAIMEEIQRQKDPGLREAVALAARGEASASLSCLSDVREVRDDHERRRAIAADYARLPEAERARTIVVAGTNEARREINRAVREDLGLAGHGRDFATLARRDTTQAERAFAKNYSPGEVIQPERDYPRAGLARGGLYEVMENGPGNRLTVRGEKGEVVEFSPITCRRQATTPRPRLRHHGPQQPGDDRRPRPHRPGHEEQDHVAGRLLRRDQQGTEGGAHLHRRPHQAPGRRDAGAVEARGPRSRAQVTMRAPVTPMQPGIGGVVMRWRRRRGRPTDSPGHRAVGGFHRRCADFQVV